MDWISQTESRALTEHTLYFEVIENKSNDSRFAEIIFHNQNNELKDTLIIKQNPLEVSVTVNVTTPGTLKSLMGDDYLNITSLKIIGKINYDDIYYLEIMLGGNEYADCGKLKNLDLSEAICSTDFNNCINLQSIILPKNLTKIEDFAFRGCKNLTSITIPSSVTAIGETNSWNSYPFYGCSNIKNVYITDIEAWCNIEFIKPISNPLANGANLYLNGELLSELVIPESVKVIKPQTFYGSGIKKVTMHEAIQSIGNL